MTFAAGYGDTAKIPWRLDWEEKDSGISSMQKLKQ